MSLGDLEKELQQKLEADRQKIEAVYSQELEKLKNNLAKERRSVLNTITTDMETFKQKMIAQLRWYLLLPGATLISLCLIFLGMSWAMMRSLANQQQEIQIQKKTNEILKNKNWQVELYETEQGRFLILPPNTKYPTNWKCNNKPCLKL